MPDQSAAHHDRPRGGGRILLAITRVWIPVGIAVVGIVAIIIGGGKDDIIAGAGVSLVIAALIVWMINWMYRISVQSNRDREQEERAREYFDVHGRWPDE
jgi:hypothetical protein